MTHKKLFGIATLVLAALVAASVSAFAKGSRTVNLSLPAHVGGTQIAAGEYQVNWEVHSSTVTVAFKKGSKVMATASGKLVDRDVKYDRNALVFGTNPDGSNTITEIRLAGMKQAIVLGE